MNLRGLEDVRRSRAGFKEEIWDLIEEPRSGGARLGLVPGPWCRRVQLCYRFRNFLAWRWQGVFGGESPIWVSWARPNGGFRCPPVCLPCVKPRLRAARRHAGLGGGEDAEGTRCPQQDRVDGASPARELSAPCSERGPAAVFLLPRSAPASRQCLTLVGVR